jgi:5,10-methylenetetrahydromethanopterin reductase
LDPGEAIDSPRVRKTVGPWGVVPWHAVYAVRGATAVDRMPGGAEWRAALEALAPEAEWHLLAFEGHVTHLSERDILLLDHIDYGTMVGDAAAIRQNLEGLAATGYSEAMYTPSGPDVARELRAFIDASRST